MLRRVSRIPATLTSAAPKPYLRSPARVSSTALGEMSKAEI